MSANSQKSECPLQTFAGDHFVNSARVETGFLDHMKAINRYAGECGVKVLVTHSFRKEGVSLTDTVEPPSKTSNHLVGHAIDMNLYYEGSKLCNSKCLINESAWPEGVRCFISKIRQNKDLRWGGDFETKDPVHIDDGLYCRDRALYKKLYDTLQENC